MNQSFNDNLADAVEKEDLPPLYKTNGLARNVCFVWPDGRRKFWNYAYLASCDYDPGEGSITLNFTSAIVTIKGIGLQPLHQHLVFHLPLYIICTDERYETLHGSETVITSIIYRDR